MKNQLVAALMLTALVGGTAAQAQGRWDRNDNRYNNNNRHNNNWNYNANNYGANFTQSWFANMQAKISSGIQTGRLTRGEARSLQNRLDSIRNMHARMSRNGINPRERQQLVAQLQAENDRINRELHDGQFVGNTYFNKYRHY